jgi:hypothetical protein
MNVTFFDPAHAHAPEIKGLNITIHWQYFKLGIVTLTVILAVVYLVMLNGLATQGFDVQILKADQLALHKEIEAIDISLAIPSSLYALESNELIQNLPTAEKKSFLEVRDTDFVFNY